MVTSLLLLKMTQKEADKEWTNLFNEIRELESKKDDSEYKLEKLREEIKDEANEANRLLKSVQNKSNALPKIQNEIRSIEFKIKEKETRQKFLEDNFNI